MTALTSVPPSPAGSDGLLSDVGVFEASAVGTAFTDVSGRFRRVNAAFARLMGRRPSDLVGATFASLTSAKDLVRSELALKELMAGVQETVRFEKRYMRPDNAEVWVDLTVRALTGPDGRIAGFLTQGVDITQSKEAELAAERDRWQLGAAEHVAGLGSFEQDTVSEAIHASAELFRILGLPAGAGLDVPTLIGVVHPDDRAALGGLIAGCQSDRTGGELTHRVCRPDGTLRWVHVRVECTVDSDGRGAILGCVLDITERKAAEEALEHETLYDPLTGLPNRILLTDRLRHQLEVAERRGGRVGVLVLDIDRFKTINDSLGHSVGDSILREIASRIVTVMRPGDTVGRFVGDEFVVLCNDVSGTETRRVAQRLVETVRRPMRIADLDRTVTVSVGLVEVTGACLPETALRDAETAMYRAKQDGRNRVATFDAALGVETAARFEAAPCARPSGIRTSSSGTSRSWTSRH